MGLNWVVQTQKQEDFFRKNIHKETLSYFLLLICKEITIIGDTITNLQVDTTQGSNSSIILSKEINYALIYGGTILFSHTQVISHQFLPLSLVRWLGMLMSLTNKGKEYYY
jgi:hypothetical protein